MMRLCRYEGWVLVRTLWVSITLVECYSNHTTTRIRIQTARLAFGGTGLCSCRVSVDGSCAKHLTVESYMVIYAPNSYTY